MNKENILAAIAAFRENKPMAILTTVAGLTDSERLVVQLVLELTAPPAKKKRSDAGTKRTKGAAS